MLSTLVPIAILLVVYGALAVVAWGRPLLGRLAWREAVRRPGQSALLVAGMMFGTAAILGMQGVYDTFNLVTTQQIYNRWGRTDITVNQGGQPFSADVASALASDPRVAAGAAGVQGGFLLIGSAADLDRQLSTTPIQIVTFDASRPGFGNFTLKDGRVTDGASFGTSGAILSPTLAARLEAQPGDQLQLSFAVAGHVSRLTFRVAGVNKLGAAGVIGSQLGIFVPLRAIQSALGGDSVNVVRISARGDGQQEVDRARALAPVVRAAVAALPGGSSLEVREVKAQDLDTNQHQGGSARPAFVALSVFVVVAATALVINLSLALAEERRPRLAILRALGITRSSLIGLALVEGGLYSLAAALVGVVPGLAYTYFVDARPLPQVIRDFSGAATGAELFTVTPTSIALSICAGALITLATILAVSIRTSRLAISSAIRDLPDSRAQHRQSWLRLAWPVSLAVAGAAAWLPGDRVLRTLGGAALILAASTLASRRLPERARATLTGVAMVAWAFAAILTAPVVADFGPAVALDFAALAVAVFGASVAVSANLRLVELGTTLVSARSAATLRPPLAYLARRPVRSGLATGAFALVLAALAYFAVLIPSIAPDPRAGGFDVRVKVVGSRAFAIPPSLESRVASTESMTTLAYVGPMNVQSSGAGSGSWQSSFAELYQLTDEQLSHPPLSLGLRDPHYASDSAAWQAIRDDPTLVMGAGGNLGDISFVSNAGVVRFHIVGTVAGLILDQDGYVGSERAFSSLSANGEGTTVLIRTEPGTDVRAFTRDLRRATFGQGVDAVSSVELLDHWNEGASWWFGFFTLLLQTAVVVGVLSLGILALRAAIERRRTIGVLRALGYRPRQVLGGLLVEATVTATVGIAVGIGIGLGVAFLFGTLAGNTLIRVDLAQVATPAVLIYAAVLLVTIGPAVQASRLPASEALRIVG